MNRWANVIYLALPAAVCAAGCSYSSSDDYGVVVSWLLNGLEPTAELCREQGIARVRLTVDDGPGKPVSVEADCDETLILSDGLSYGAFETNASFEFGVGYAYEVEFLDKKGKALYGYDSTLVAYANYYTPVELDTIDVFEPLGSQAKLTAAWFFEGGTRDTIADDCANNGVEKVSFWIASATDEDFANAYVIDEIGCEEGAFESRDEVLASGDYLIKYVALDDRGASAEQSEPIAVYVDEPGTVHLPRQIFQGL
jgi:hypothetical protein